MKLTIAAHTILLASLASAAEKSTRGARRLAQTAGTESLSSPLDTTGCFAAAKDGGWGFCGPLSCKDQFITCYDEDSDSGGARTVDGVAGGWSSEAGESGASCKPFIDRTNIVGDVADETNFDPKGSCSSSCTQQTTGVCSAEFLEGVIAGSGVKTAYCNDKYLVIMASGASDFFQANLNDIPFPPGGTGLDGQSGRTGMASIDATKPQELYFPLDVTFLSASAGSNNIAVYDSQSGSGPNSYLIDGSDPFGLPADAGIGMSTNGMPIFPVYNNNAKMTPQKCEVDRCNLHVGQGGGAPHFHGDMFGDETTTACMYGPSNYTEAGGIEGHPPVVGFSYDGILIYGRYLSDAAPGFAAPLLDDCGGHAHADTDDVDEWGNSLAAYHYHTQAFDATVESGQMADAGETYVQSTPGPFKCWKADLAASITAGVGSSAINVAHASPAVDKSQMSYRCCGMTDYYALNGVSFGNSDLAAESKCEAPAAPSKGSYEGTTCATPGASLNSGNSCRLACELGYGASGTGMTKCVGGVLTEVTCEATDGATDAPTPTEVAVTDAPSAAVTDSPSAAATEAPTSDDDVEKLNGAGVRAGAGVGTALALLAGAFAVELA
jgi:hypothetical protein